MVVYMLFTSWTMKLSHDRGYFAMVKLSCFNFYNNVFFKPLGPWLGVTEHGPREVTMYQKVDVLVFNIINDPKKNNLGSFFMFDFLPFFFPSFVIIITTLTKKKKKKKCIFTMVLWHVQWDNCFTSPTAKPIGPWQLIM